MLNRAKQDGLLHTIMCSINLSLVVTSVYFSLLLCRSRNDSHQVLKTKKGKWGDTMINAIAKMAYFTGDRVIQLAEWVTEPQKGNHHANM
jgi:hypothetical protein